MDRGPLGVLPGRPGSRHLPGSAGRAGIVIVVVACVVGAIVILPAAHSIGPIPSAPASLSAPVASDPPPAPGHEVYGFVPYWEIDATIAAHLRATPATTVALFSVTNTAKGDIDRSQKGFKAIDGAIGRQIVSDAHALGRRVDVTWTSFGQARNDALFASDTTQARVIAALVELRADLGVDGIAVDVESIGDADIPAYGLFIGRLANELRASDPAATITATTGAGPQGAALALAATLAGADRIFLMGYDYRTATSDPGASAPISRGDGGERSIAASLELYATAGVPVERTILGLPLYGLSWPTASPEAGAPSTGRGEIWIPRRNLAALVEPGVLTSYDPVEEVAFLAIPAGKGWRAVYYDSPRSLRPKLALANRLGLAGAGFWALGYERGLPEYTDLIAAFRGGASMDAPSGPELSPGPSAGGDSVGASAAAAPTGSAGPAIP